MLSHLVPGSPVALGLLVACFGLVLAFEFSNGFHDTANAVATVIYTNALTPVVAVIWSGLMNFAGVLVGGIAVAYALVELLPADVLSPPNGQPCDRYADRSVRRGAGLERGDLGAGPAELEFARVGRVSGRDRGGLRQRLNSLVDYAPIWVRVISALCLGLGTMIGYKRIVRKLGERIGNTHLVPAQGASAEIVAAGLIGAAGFSGFPVSTTHVVTSGIAGTMVGSGSGIQMRTVWQIAAAWILTLPATVLLSGGLFYLLS